MSPTCVMKVLSQFIFSDILAKFPENANEVFNRYKSVGIFVKFAKNHSYVRLSLVVEYWHFEAVAKNVQLLRVLHRPQYKLCFIWISFYSCRRRLVLFAKRVSHLTRYTLLTSYSIVKPTKDDLVRLIYMQVFKRRLITWIQRWAKYWFWPFIITSLLFSSLWKVNRFF